MLLIEFLSFLTYFVYCLKGGLKMTEGARVARKNWRKCPKKESSLFDFDLSWHRSIIKINANLHKLRNPTYVRRSDIR